MKDSGVSYEYTPGIWRSYAVPEHLDFHPGCLEALHGAGKDQQPTTPSDDVSR